MDDINEHPVQRTVSSLAISTIANEATKPLRVEIAQLQAKIAELEAENQQLRARVAELEREAGEWRASARYLDSVPFKEYGF